MTIRPSVTFFHDEKLKKFFEYLQKKMPMPITDSYCKNESKIQKFAETSYFIQYGYETPKNVLLSFNARGIIINTEYNRSSNPEPIETLESLKTVM